MLLTISGLPGSGTTTVSKLLSKYYDVDLISAGEVFRKLADEYGMTLEEFGNFAESDPSIDLEIDRRQQKIASEKNNCILEGRLAGYMAETDNVLKIWLKAPLDVRVERLIEREGGSFDEIFESTKKREASENARYWEIHGIDLTDMSIYDLVVDTSRWNQTQIKDILRLSIDILGGFS
ncbi:(d)CMP kinase [Methanohalobium sp.]|uniref:(d)CMP kinase n=1 Tax=Methanohalobium sp. TaxID=2837493 RepID=UPI0025F90017|nr:AAA family ATPase [Methanohalobium sp.]